MTKKLDDTQLKKVTGAGQDPEARDCDRLECGDPGGGGGGGNNPEPVDIDNPGLQHIQQ